MNDAQLVFSRRLRQSPFEARSRPGARGLSVYNHVVLPLVYESLEADYHHLREHVQLWDVACQVQVEIRGPDALRFVEFLTPRDLSVCEPGRCMYAPLIDEAGGIVNDPIILCLAPDRYWLSISDSDVLLWVKGLLAMGQWDAEAFDPDVYPMSVQGPKSDELMCHVVGDAVRDLKFFRFTECDIAGSRVVVARTGWSGQGGFEIYLGDAARGIDLWDALADAGKELNVRPGAPNLIDRLETGLLSYGSDMTLDNNPFEVGLDRFFKMGKAADYLGRAALEKIAADGPTQKLVRVVLEGDPVAPPRNTCALQDKGGSDIGFVTSMAYSPRLEKNIGFGFVPAGMAEVGTALKCTAPAGSRPAQVVDNTW